MVSPFTRSQKIRSNFFLGGVYRSQEVLLKSDVDVEVPRNSIECYSFTYVGMHVTAAELQLQ
jgi:hypothetical protein